MCMSQEQPESPAAQIERRGVSHSANYRLPERSAAVGMWRGLLTGLVWGLVAGSDPRYLVYTSGGGVFKFIVGFGVPVQVPMPVIFAHNFQFQYNAVDNATKLDELAQAGILRSLHFSKHMLYSHLSSFLRRNGQESGCLLKFMCEIGEAPIDRNGLVGELLQLLFTPEEEDPSEFRQAWQNGTEGLGCETLRCPPGQGFLDYFSFLA